MAVLSSILVVNAGSSSLKLRVLDSTDTVLASRDLPAPRGTPGSDDAGQLGEIIAGLGPVEAVGHRVVHGGTEYSTPVLIDAKVRQRLGALTDLAPLHQPKSLGALDWVQAALPDVPGVACFDTAFHSSIPAAAATYALPEEWRTRWALRKFGFHGLSHAYVSRRAAQLTGAAGKLVSCHLGAGASLAAVRDGISVDTTMGFTPLDGLVMATRSGALDPGLVLWLESHAGMPAGEVAAALEHRSGLYGLAGTADMREVLARAASGDGRARLARDAYLHRLRSLVGGMAAAMDGIDTLVFTGGVGQNSAEIRERTMDGLGFLGVRIDTSANAEGTGDRSAGDHDGGDHDGGDRDGGDREIGAAGAPVRTLVIGAREDIEIARQVRSVLGALPAPTGSVLIRL